MRELTMALVVAATAAVGLAAGGEAGSLLEPPESVRIPAQWFAEPVRRAVRGAARRLADPFCQSVLVEFKDPAGRVLRERLDELSLDASSYSRLVFFYDGTNERQCRDNRRLYAFTMRGSRVVWACPPLAWLAITDLESAEVVVIHEVLHTLGLAENPPSPQDITTQVERRCRP